MSANRYALFLRLLQQSDSAWVAEHRFHPVRRWRFDFAHPARRLAIEVDGGVWTGGRHSRGAGQLADMEKSNAAVALGWRVLHFTPQQVTNGEALRVVASVLHADPPRSADCPSTASAQALSLRRSTHAPR